MIKTPDIIAFKGAPGEDAEIIGNLNKGWGVGLKRSSKLLSKVSGSNAFMVGFLSGAISSSVGALFSLCPTQDFAKEVIEASIGHGYRLHQGYEDDQKRGTLQ